MSVNEMLMAAAGQAGGANEYVEDCFATHLYTGTGASQTITNGIDLAGKGGLTWIKSRSNTQSHYLIDSERGISKLLNSNNTFGQGTDATNVTAYNSSGFTVQGADVNASTYTYASWTFRKAPKFFDVVTYTGNGSNRTIAHNLGSVPGMIIVKRTDTTGSWFVYHRGTNGGTNPQNFYTLLNDTLDQTASSGAWNNTAPTSTVFSVGTTGSVNANGGTFVAYLFAHDAGGFGDAGTDNIISCGSYTGNGATDGPTITLGYEPQYVLIKRTDSTADWEIIDNMRGFVVGTSDDAVLFPNTSGAEAAANRFAPLATGFKVETSSSNANASGGTYIYMAIRRPMKIPTSGTQVFESVARNATAPNQFSTNLSYVDMTINRIRASGDSIVSSRLTGTNWLRTNQTTADTTEASSDLSYAYNFAVSPYWWSNNQAEVNWLFKRATGFFDVVCYTGNGASTQAIYHNLGVKPELVIIKSRSSGSTDWYVTWGHTNAFTNSAARLQTTNAATSETSSTTGIYLDSTDGLTFFEVLPRSSGIAQTNTSGRTYVAYLFASLNGISKFGTYTGNGTNQTINCGFSAGARFVLIKRTDSTGDWCVFDTARGIVSGNDPFLQLNTTDAEVTGEDAVDPDNSGFIVNQTTENLNVNNATYIYLAIA